MDDLMEKHQMLLQEDLNVEVDDKADISLRKSVREDTCMSPNLPYEQVKVVDKETK